MTSFFLQNILLFFLYAKSLTQSYSIQRDMPRPRLAVAHPGDVSEAALFLRFPNDFPLKLGAQDDVCTTCHARHWRLERPVRLRSNKNAQSHSTCCQQGGVKLPVDHLDEDMNTIDTQFHKRLLTSSDIGMSSVTSLILQSEQWIVTMLVTLTRMCLTQIASNSVRRYKITTMQYRSPP